MRGLIVGRSAWSALWALSALALASCSSAPRQSYTAADAAVAVVAPTDVRTWGDTPSRSFAARVDMSIKRAGAGRASPAYLALSGGGGDGAYGAGLLNGWTRSGKRPEFVLVSGVSTGALMAPFAYLGSRYDATLRELYTSGIAESIVAAPNLLGGLVGNSFIPNDRLREIVAQYVTPELLSEIAREHARGRLLIVITTNLDSQRPVVWDMGAIATEATPASLRLFRDVLVASASVPALLPPMLIDAQANGRFFEEMHVDGSVSGNVFTLPSAYLVGSGRALYRGGIRRMFVLLNTTPLAEFDIVENKTFNIIARTQSTSLKKQTIDNLRLTYRLARQVGIDFNVRYPEGPDADGAAFGFDTARMRRLYSVGEEIGSRGSFWRKAPPSEETTTELASR